MCNNCEAVTVVSATENVLWYYGEDDACMSRSHGPPHTWKCSVRNERVRTGLEWFSTGTIIFTPSLQKVYKMVT
jgi:hypothetical protein